LSQNIKNNFTLVELGPLHKNEPPNLSVTRVTTHSKQEVSDNTLKKMSTTVQKGLNTTTQEDVYKKITKDQVGRIERS
jgi:hypothetical protein